MRRITDFCTLVVTYIYAVSCRIPYFKNCILENNYKYWQKSEFENQHVTVNHDVSQLLLHAFLQHFRLAKTITALADSRIYPCELFPRFS